MTLLQVGHFQVMMRSQSCFSPFSSQSNIFQLIGLWHVLQPVGQKTQTLRVFISSQFLIYNSCSINLHLGHRQVRSLVGKITWRRKWQPTPVFLPGESHGQRSLEGYSLQGCKESDTTEETQHAHTFRLQVDRKTSGVPGHGPIITLPNIKCV